MSATECMEPQIKDERIMGSVAQRRAAAQGLAGQCSILTCSKVRGDPWLTEEMEAMEPAPQVTPDLGRSGVVFHR